MRPWFWRLAAVADNADNTTSTSLIAATEAEVDDVVVRDFKPSDARDTRVDKLATRLLEVWNAGWAVEDAIWEASILPASRSSVAAVEAVAETV